MELSLGDIKRLKKLQKTSEFKASANAPPKHQNIVINNKC